jgi:alginate O-acetyltransferase complex protein AlgI
MLFNSLDFLFFFLVVFVLYWSFANKYKWIILLISSYFFYGYWNPIFLSLIFFSTFVDYFFSLYLTSSSIQKKRKWGLGLSLFLNFGLLFSFKYYDFFVECFNWFFNSLLAIDITLPEYTILLPVGISFYTFQAVSYAIDVYRMDIKPERHFGKFALFISFFPQLVAGPIERATDLLPQINKLQKQLSSDSFTQGIKHIIWGLFLKVVVADNLATLIDVKFNAVHNQSGGGLFFALFLFAFQLYSDFNGYSKMALGLAILLGYKLKNNFNYPFISSSFKDFWRRWHISLSEWIRDYLFFPLGGTFVKPIKIIRNIFISFFLIGLWHGASINYILWGIFSGLLLIIEYLLNKYIIKEMGWWKKITFLKRISVFSLFCLSIVPVRSLNINDTISIYEKLFTSNISDIYFWFADNRYSPGIIGLYILIFIELWFGLNLNSKYNLKNSYTNIAFYTILFFMIILLGNDSGAQFIYFQF